MNGETRPRTRAKAYVGGIGFDSKKLAERIAAMVERVAQSAYERGEAKGNAEGFRAAERSSAAIAEACRLIERALARLHNSDMTAPGTPERHRFVETTSMLRDAMGLLQPDEAHPEDSERYHAMRRTLSDGASHGDH